MLSYVIVQLRSDRVVVATGAILTISSTDASVRYTENLHNRKKTIKKKKKKKHIIYKTVFKSDMC